MTHSNKEIDVNEVTVTLEVDDEVIGSESWGRFVSFTARNLEINPDIFPAATFTFCIGLGRH